MKRGQHVEGVVFIASNSSLAASDEEDAHAVSWQTPPKSYIQSRGIEQSAIVLLGGLR